MSDPSDKAVQAAQGLLVWDDYWMETVAAGSAKEILSAAHDPALGLDRSVCLRDVVERLRSQDAGVWTAEHLHSTADFIEREFGGER